MIHNIKELFPEYVLLVKIGTFYECYNEDSYMMSYLFQYKWGKKLYPFLVYGIAGIISKSIIVLLM